jgi:hypothetical protein
LTAATATAAKRAAVKAAAAVAKVAAVVKVAVAVAVVAMAAEMPKMAVCGAKGWWDPFSLQASWCASKYPM